MSKPTISEAKRSLESFFTLHAKVIIDRNEFISAQLISWSRRSGPVMHRIPYGTEYEQLLNERNYTCLFDDKSFAQVFYRFDNNDVVSAARLAYYPAPEALLVEPVDDHINAYDDIDLDQVRVGYSNSHIRYDYDSLVSSHAKSHLQFGFVDSLRITSQRILLPFLFLDYLRRFFDPSHRAISQHTLYTQTIAFEKRCLAEQPVVFEDTHFSFG